MVIEADIVEAYEAFLTLYPKFEYVVRIRTLVDRRVEMIAWYEATIINDAIAYENFLVHYPDSDLAATAKRLQERAKNRSLSPDVLARAGSAQGAPRVITKIVEKPVTKIVEKPVVVTRIVEKPVVVTKIVKQIVRVPTPCRCDCERPTRRKTPIIIQRPTHQPTIRRSPSHSERRTFSPNFTRQR